MPHVGRCSPSRPRSMMPRLTHLSTECLALYFFRILKTKVCAPRTLHVLLINRAVPCCYGISLDGPHGMARVWMSSAVSTIIPTVYTRARNRTRHNNNSNDHPLNSARECVTLGVGPLLRCFVCMPQQRLSRCAFSGGRRLQTHSRRLLVASNKSKI